VALDLCFFGMPTQAEEPVYADIGLMAPAVVLPPEGTDMRKWSVIACDQYTSEPAYWKRVADLVGDSPSMLHLTYPEVYLPQKRDEEIIAGILKKMEEYKKNNVFIPQTPGFVLVDRKTPAADSRLGLVVALDLELYSFAKGSQSLIRPTEKTIESRLPPRIAIRKDASYESPHILVLIDDPDKTVIEPLAEAEKKGAMRKLYDFDLMEDSGHLTGHHVADRKDMDQVAEALRQLGSKERFREKYGAGPDQDPILFAVGDGNHSLATAKRCWELVKAKGAGDDHPARFALVELNNVHDPGLSFHPIHRLIEGVDPGDMMEKLKAFFEAQGSKVSFEEGARHEETEAVGGGEHAHKFEFVSKGTQGVFTITNPKMVLAAATVDSWLNGYVEANEKAALDYVHEEYTIKAKCSEESTTVGLLLPTINKNDLLKTVVKEGTLPRKTFSMGHAPEKRFYCECRAILP